MMPLEEDLEYTKMCEKAIEIHGPFQCKVDYRSRGYCIQHKCLLEEGYDGSCECPKNEVDFRKKDWDKEDCEFNDKHIGIPDQAQLQEMLIADGGDFFDLCCEPEGWLLFVREIGEEQIYPREKKHGKTYVILEEDYSESAEQALLKGVMKINYGKTWSGKEWI